MAAAAQEFAERGGTAATPRMAATVLLLRPEPPGSGSPGSRSPGSRPSGLEVYLLRRVSTMAFAPSMYAFPGGSVDPRDSEVSVGWAGPAPSTWARRFGLSPAAAQAVLCAAVREVFEECGVLLAGPDDVTVVGDVSGSSWESARIALLAREVALADVLADRGLVLRSDLLVPWGRWVTPPFEPRRYDTFFFLARLPVNQLTRDVGGEADHVLWSRPESTTALAMLPPTAHHLRALMPFDDIDDAIGAAGAVEVSTAFVPGVEVGDDGTWFVVG